MRWKCRAPIQTPSRAATHTKHAARIEQRPPSPTPPGALARARVLVSKQFPPSPLLVCCCLRLLSHATTHSTTRLDAGTHTCTLTMHGSYIHKCMLKVARVSAHGRRRPAHDCRCRSSGPTLSPWHSFIIRTRLEIARRRPTRRTDDRGRQDRALASAPQHELPSTACKCERVFSRTNRRILRASATIERALVRPTASTRRDHAGETAATQRVHREHSQQQHQYKQQQAYQYDNGPNDSAKQSAVRAAHCARSSRRHSARRCVCRRAVDSAGAVATARCLSTQCTISVQRQRRYGVAHVDDARLCS